MGIGKAAAVAVARIRAARHGGSLGHRTIRASAWTIGGHLANQAIRLGSNLILTRLLFPEAFGIMAIVQSVMVGLALLTDVGIEPAIVQNARGRDPDFVNTAWTLQAVQGLLIWLALCALAPLLASLYAQPVLAEVLPVAGLSAVLGGLGSTKLAVANRNLALGRRVSIELGSYALGVVATILLAWIDRSVWALVWGGLIGASLKTLSSHLFTEGERNRFAWEWSAAKELFGFGQWVFVSSSLTFLAGEGNKLLLGAFLGVKLLALFTLASTMSLMFWQIAQLLNNRVFFPAYSEVARDRPERLRQISERSRMFLIVPGWLIALFFVLWGDVFMSFLYDQRYAGSGHMLRILGMGSLVGVIGNSYGGLLWAKGMVRTSTVVLGLQILIQVVGMLVGNHFLGDRGVILSAALVTWLLYPVQAYVHAKIGLWQPKLDLPFLILSILVVAVYFGEAFARM
ncbi:MAG TPA: oligosaccharide flippase family protein [Rhodocyclaceae bacterium]